MNKEIVLIELFSGIGGFAKGLEDAGFIIKKHYFSEIDKHAIANYKYNFPNAEYVGSVQDAIRYTYSERPDIITFGWPCQDNSIAGKRKGQRRGTRSGLLFDAGNIIFKLKPKCFIAENVKGLYSVNEGFDFYEAVDFLTYLNTDSPQYTVEMQLLDTDWFLPQNRERTYFVGHIGTRCEQRVFPIGEANEVSITTQQAHGNRIVMPTLMAQYSKQPTDGAYIKVKSATNIGYELASNGDSINFSVPNSDTRRGRVGKNKAQTLDTQCNQGVIQNNQLRRYTENEVEQLQGFPINWTKYGVYADGINEIPRGGRYKLCGNAVSTVMPKVIGERLLNIEYGEYQLSHSTQNEVSEVFNKKDIEQNNITEQYNLFEV